MAGERILIVEDESISALDIRARLEGMGYKVIGVAANGRAALDLARDGKPDLMLMDIMLEGDLDGVQTAMFARELQIPVVYLTAYTDAETIERAKQAGPLGFIRKPLDERDLNSMVEMALYKSRTDRELRDSETRYKRLVESVTDYIFTVRIENGRAVSTTHGPACVAVTGYSLEEYQADHDLWFKMVPLPDRPMVLDHINRLLAGQAVEPIEHRLIQKDGSLIWVRNTSVPHFDREGRLISYDGLVTNITARKIADEKLKEHARKLGIINRVILNVNKARNLSVLLNPALDASLDLLNFSCGAIFLFSENAAAAELVCWKGAADDCVSRLTRIDISGSEHWKSLLAGEYAFAGQEEAATPEFAMKWKARAVARVPLVSQDRAIGGLVMANPIPNVFSGEEKSLLLSIGRQLGAAIAKLRSEAALRESEEKYRMLSEQSLAGIQIIKSGRLILVNDGWCRIFGYAREEALSWGPDELFKIAHPADRDFFADQIRKKQSGQSDGARSVYDCRFICKTGETKWALIHSKPVMFSDGLAVVGVVVDITDRKLAEQALAEANSRLKAGEERLMAANKELSDANREKEVLLKEVHHRVKNNLQVVYSLFNLQMEHVKDDAARAMIRECRNRIKSIAIVHEKLYQSRNLASIDLGDFLQSLISHLFQTFLVSPDSIRMNLAVEHAMLDIDQAIPCCLIINELVTNALKYAFPQGRKGVISIAIKSDDPPQDASGNARYVLAIGDNGVGFPAGLDFRRTTSLGMQLVLTFVEQLGGDISLDTGRGTTFTIRFAEQ